MSLDAITDAISKIADFFKWLIDQIDHLKDIITDWWNKVSWSIFEAGASLWDYIEDTIEDIADFIASGIDSIDDAIRNIFGDFVIGFQDFTDMLNSSFYTLTMNLSDNLASIWNSLDDLGYLISDTLADLGETISKTMIAGIDYMAENFVDLGETISNQFVSIVQEAMTELETSLGPHEAEISTALSFAGPHQYAQIADAVKGALTWLGEQFYKSILAWLEYEPPAEPEKAMGAVGRYIELVTAFNVIPMIIAKMPDFLEPFKNFELDKIIQQLYWSLGLGWLSWIVFAEPFRAIIADPLSEYFRAKYKTAPLPRSLVDEAYKKHIINEELYRKYLEQLGYRKEYIDLFVWTAYNAPTESLLKYGVETGSLKYEELAEYAKMKGYDNKMTSLYTIYIHDQALGKEKELTQSQILRAYRNGIITRDTALQMLKDLGYSDEKAQILLELEDADQSLELRELNIKIVLEDLKDGVITEQEAITKLVSLGVSESKAKLLTELTLARKRKEVREKITKADIKSLYEHGLIDRDTAKDFLLNIGYSEHVAEMLLSVWDMDKAEEPKQLTKSEILKAYKLGLISRDTAKKMLIDLGYDSETAELIIKIQEAEEARQIREYKIREILEDLKDGYITREEAINKLKELGVDDARAIAIIDYELAKSRVERRKTPTLSQIEQFFKYGLIDEDTAKTWLSLLGYTDNLINVFIQLWKLKTEPDQKEASRSLITQAFKYGILDYQQALNMLKDIGYPEELARMILDIEVAKEINDLTNDKAENILLKFRYGLIDEDTARKLLYDLGLAPARVEILIEREKIKKEKPEKPRRITATMVLRALRDGLISIEEADQWLYELGYTIDKDRMLMIALYIADLLQENTGE